MMIRLQLVSDDDNNNDAADDTPYNKGCSYAIEPFANEREHWGDGATIQMIIIISFFFMYKCPDCANLI